jgi:hypothetical protein
MELGCVRLKALNIQERHGEANEASVIRVSSFQNLLESFRYIISNRTL